MCVCVLVCAFENVRVFVVCAYFVFMPVCVGRLQSACVLCMRVDLAAEYIEEP